MVFQNKMQDLDQCEDMVKFRVAWWFKHYGRGSKEPLTLMLLIIKDRCCEVKRIKKTKLENWITPALDINLKI